MNTEVQEQPPAGTSDVLSVSETKENVNKIVTTKESDQSDQITCSNKNITEWRGFDEATDEPKCKTVKSFKLTSYRCDISKNAFGASLNNKCASSKKKTSFGFSKSPASGIA